MERIIVAPLPETGNDESSGYENVDDSVPQGLLHLNFFFEKPPSRETIEKFGKAMNRLVYQQGLPVNRIVWGGLVSWGGVQPSHAGQETMMKAVRMLKDGYLRNRLAKEASDRTVQLPGSASHKSESSVSDALPQWNANTPHSFELNVLGKRGVLILSACFLTVLLIRTPGPVHRNCVKLWSRFR